MQNIINSTLTVSDIKRAAAEGWTPSNVLGAVRLITERKAQVLQNIVDSLESEVYQVFGDRADALMNSMPYGVDDVTDEEWDPLCHWYTAASHSRNVYASDSDIAEVLHVGVSSTLSRVADVIRKEWEVFGLNKF